MSWKYENTRPLNEAEWDETTCSFCATTLRILELPSSEQSYLLERLGPAYEATRSQALVCDSCGWWKAYRRKEYGRYNLGILGWEFGATAILRQLSLSQNAFGLEEIQQYLASKSETMPEFLSSRLESAVKSICGGYGYSVRVVGQSLDGGISVILDGSGETVGVQVMRHVNTISVEQICALSGASVFDGTTRGVYVTTSRLQGSMAPAGSGGSVGHKIDLLNAVHFYDALGLSSRSEYRTAGEFVQTEDMTKLFRIGEWCDIQDARVDPPRCRFYE